MGRKRKTRENDFTTRFHAGKYDADDTDAVQKLDNKDKSLQRRKIADTAQLRAETESTGIDLLPLGRVRQVHSLYVDVEVTGQIIQCTLRKTIAQRRSEVAVVGDFVRVRAQPRRDETGPLEGVVERIEPRTTLLTRADSFKALTAHPIVANADQMMIVVAVTHPQPKWGLVDRMLIAAAAGGLTPIVCLNKIDLGKAFPEALAEARDVMAHYRTLGHRCEETCATRPETAPLLQSLLANHRTVLAGHSGVGKSTLVNQSSPTLDVRIGDISDVHLKGKHTTTSARIYPLPDLSPTTEIIDTPGVKLFGLWNVTEDTLPSFFPDLDDNTAPPWRRDSYDRILDSLGKRQH